MFNLMVAGDCGLGKSTLPDSLFVRDHLGSDCTTTKTLQVATKTVKCDEGENQLVITLVDTAGFGDALDQTDCSRSIMKYIDHQFERWEYFFFSFTF